MVAANLGVARARDERRLDGAVVLFFPLRMYRELRDAQCVGGAVIAGEIGSPWRLNFRSKVLVPGEGEAPGRIPPGPPCMSTESFTSCRTIWLSSVRIQTSPFPVAPETFSNPVVAPWDPLIFSRSLA